MKQQQADELVAGCAKLASKADKVVAYVIVYATQKGVIHTQRGGPASAQVGLAKVAESNIMRGFEQVRK